MSLISLLTSVSGKIKASPINDILSALRLQFVGRNSSGDPAAGQDLGTVIYPWGTGNFQNLNVGGGAIDTSNIVSPANRIVSGAVRANSESPQYLDIDGINDELTVLGTTTSLELSINSTAVSVATDILFQNLVEAPGSNNTCLVNDASLADQLRTKYIGEDNTTLIIDNAGSEITDRIGELVALKKNGGSEIMLAFVKSATELTNIYRGFFYSSADAPIVRETLADNDQLDLMSLGRIFLENTGTSGEISYLDPVYSFTEPAAPVSGLYWFDMTNNIWTRYDGADFIQINRTIVGLVVVDATKSIGYRPVDFFHDYRDTNTINLKVASDTVIESVDKTNNVYVYSKTLRTSPTKPTWDNTANMETGSVAASTKYYLYEASTGERKVSLEKPYDRNDLRGKYHPYEAWRSIGEGVTDVNSDWVSAFATGIKSTTKAVDFEENDAILDVFDSTNITYTAKSITTRDRGGIPTFMDSPDLNWDSAIDVVGNQALKNSHWYGLMVDSGRNVKMAPDLTGTAGATTAGFLVWAAGTLVTDGFKRGAIVYNLTQGTKTTISVTPTVDNANIALVDDIFVLNDLFKIVMQSPTGLGDSWERLGAVEVDSGGNFDDSYYEHIQEKKHYFGDITGDLDFTTSAATLTGGDTYISISQVKRPNQESFWVADINGRLQFPSATSLILTISGIAFKYFTAMASSNDPGNEGFSGGAQENLSTIKFQSPNASVLTFEGRTILLNKPTFHH